MTLRVKPESVREHAESGRPLSHVRQLRQLCIGPLRFVLQQDLLKKFIRLFTVTVSLAAVSYAGVTITSPQNGTTVNSPVHVVAGASSANPITFMRIYVDNVSVFGKATSKIDTLVSMAAGRHSVVVQAWDSKSVVSRAVVTITVRAAPSPTPTPGPSPTPTPTPPGSTGVTISAPANGATVASPVHVVASAASANPITTMRIYVDNVSAFVNTTNKIDTLVTMASGRHNVVVQAWDSKGTVFKTAVTITVNSNATPTPTPAPGVTVASPRNGAILAAPVHVVASASSKNPITAMRIYVDSTSVYANTTNKIDTLVNVATGPHSMVVQAWDSTGAVFKTPLNLTVNQATTLSTETSNNTSAPDSFAAQSNGNAAAGNISKVSVRTLLYSGATAKIYAHFMAWFGSAKHMNIGYVSDDSQQVGKQITDMVSRGLNGVIVDWYGGQSDGTDYATIDHVVQLIMQESESHSGFTFAVMYDQGTLVPCSLNSACSITQRVIDDLNHANVSYWGSAAYQKSGGHPVVYFFFDQATYKVDWARVRAGVAGNPLFVFIHNDGFTHAESDGGFAWIKPELATSGDPAGLAYLSSYYSTAIASSKFSTASAYSGFDDSLAPWGKNRKVGQQCGQTWLQTLNEAGNHYSASSQLSGIQLVTWNDYEEGSEIETGIDNCVTVNASVAGTVVSWSISGQRNTIDHFSVYVSQDGEKLLPVKDAPATASSMDLAQFGLDAGSYTVFVQAIGKPSLTNKVSTGVRLTVPAP